MDIASPDRDILEDMHAINRDHPRPIVVFAQDGNCRTIEAAVRAGVSAYVVDGLNEGRVMPILQVAIARFKEFQSMRRELAEARASLAQRKLIERAKGLLMQRLQFNEEAAYSAMRKMAMDRNLRMVDLARSLVAASDLLASPSADRRDPPRPHPHCNPRRGQSFPRPDGAAHRQELLAGDGGPLRPERYPAYKKHRGSNE